MSRLERSITVNAPPERVWEVLADFGDIADWVPVIQHSCLLSDQTERVGAVRRVQIARQTLVERVVSWKPRRELAYDIEGLPPVVGTARNTWRLTGVGDNTDVTLTTELKPGRNPVKRFIAQKVLDRMALASEVMLAGLAATASTPEPAEEGAQETT